jgi:branched-chain amino acid transport system permease protein
METFPQILVNGLIVGGVYALVAIGYALAYGVLRLINFAHGGVFTVGAFSTLVLVEWLRLPIVAAIPVVILIGAALGAGIERFAYRPVRGAPLLVQLITALGVATILENSIAGIFGSDARSLPSGLISSSALGQSVGISITPVQLFTIVLALVLLVYIWWLVMNTSIGRAMRAVADDPEGAMTGGVNVNKVIGVTFSIGSAMGAVAGMTVAMDVGCDPYMGTVVGFKAFAACVIGGMRSLSGAVVGGIVIGIFENLIAGYVSTQYKTAIVMGVLITVLLFRPDGLFVNRRERLA